MPSFVLSNFRSQIFIPIFCGIFGIGLFDQGQVNSSELISPSDSKVSLEALVCVDNMDFPITRVDVWGTATFESTEYQYLASYVGKSQYPDDLVIAVNVRGECEVAFHNPGGHSVPLASQLPKPVARQLTLARYRYLLNQSGKQQFQRGVNESVAGQEEVIWFDEQVWALQQLGISIPEQVKVKE
jgi:hypothetical protein